MGASALFDALVIAPAAILGLVGLWLGFWRATAAWPFRWLLPFYGASAAGVLGALYMAVNRDLARLFYLSGPVGGAVVAAIAFGVVLALLVMFMRNLRARVAVWTGRRRTGLVERLLGGILGIACGLALVVLLYGLHGALRPERDGDAPWADGSVLLPYLKGVGQALSTLLTSNIDTPTGRPRPQR